MLSLLENKEKNMGNTFLKLHSKTPIASSFYLAIEMFKSNLKLMIGTIILYMLMLFSLQPLAVYLESDVISVLILSFIGLIIIVLILLTLIFSNMIYFGKTLKLSNNIDELKENVKNIVLKDFYFKWFFVALGHILGLSVYVSLFGIIGLLGEFSNLFYVPVFLFLLILFYTYSLVQERVILATTFKEGFIAIFNMFKVSFLKQTLNGNYFAFTFLYGILFNIISKIFDLPIKYIALSYSESSYTYIFIDTLFITFFVFSMSVLTTSIVALLSKEIIEDNEELKNL